MRFTRAFLLAAVSLAAGAPAGAAAAYPQDCAAMAGLLRQARTDFQSLREKRMDSARCSFRASEYKCEWAFPGDAFAVSDAQAAKLVQCLAVYPAAQPLKAKRGESAFAVDPDLTVLIPNPQVDADGWKVRLTIRSSWKPQ